MFENPFQLPLPTVNLGPNSPEVSPRGSLGQITPHLQMMGAVRPPRVTPTVPGYEIVGYLGEGGMSVVWLARQMAADRLVALKLLRRNGHSEIEATRFRTEAESMAKMKHPLIATIYDVGHSDEESWIAMEYCAGGTLSRFLSHKPQPAKLAAEIAETLAIALQHAHEARIIHRDLKPGNILLAQPVRAATDPESSGVLFSPNLLRVIDFGLARCLDLTDPITRTHSVMGTPTHMSPEQALGRTREATAQMDIWSLGVVLYQMISGSLPFVGTDIGELIDQIRHEDPIWPSLKVRVPQDLELICLKCLEKNPEDRYRSAGELVADLRNFQQDMSISVRPMSRAERGVRWVRRNPSWSALIFTLFLSMLVGTSVSVWQAVLASRHSDRADAEAKEARLQSQRADEKALEAQENLRQANEEKLRATEESKRATDEKIRATEQKNRADENAKQAVKQASIAQAVTSFLTHDLLQQAAVGSQDSGQSNRPLNPNITVRELLDRSAQRLKGRFTDQPLTEAAIRHTIGTTFSELGRFNEALVHLEKAHLLRQKELGNRDHDTLDTLNMIATLHHSKGNYGKAESLFREVLEAFRETNGENDLQTLSAMGNLSATYQSQKKYEEAETLLLRVIEAYRLRGTDKAEFAGTHLNALAALYYHQGKLAKAESVWLEALELVDKSGRSPDHPDTLNLMNNLAAVFMEQQKFDLAEPLVKKATESRIKLFGEEHPLTLNSINNLALLYMYQKNYPEAEKLLVKFMEVMKRRGDEFHPELLIPRINLAVVLIQLKKWEKAETVLTQLLEIDQKDPSGDSRIESMKVRLAMTRIRLKKFPQAEEALRPILELRQKKAPKERSTAESRLMLGLALAGQKKFADAEPLLVAGIEEMLKHPADYRGENVGVSEAFGELIRFYSDWEKKQDVAEWQKKFDEWQKKQ